MASSLLVGRQAPDFALATLGGTEVSLSQLPGQAVLIDFWASWCLPRREEMPELARSDEAHKAEGFIVLALNLTYIDGLPDVQAFVRKFIVTLPVPLDMDAAVAARLYQIPGVPTSVFVNPGWKCCANPDWPLTRQQSDQYVAEILK